MFLTVFFSYILLIFVAFLLREPNTSSKQTMAENTEHSKTKRELLVKQKAVIDKRASLNQRAWQTVFSIITVVNPPDTSLYLSAWIIHLFAMHERFSLPQK